jgi:hypothetical protein
MDDPTIDISTEATIELSPSQLSDIIGNQLILDQSGGPFAYLAGLAFDGMADDEYVVDILIEYIRESPAIYVTDDELTAIESMLRP